MYKDITTYSQRDKDRKPSILESEANGIKFRVHKHIYYGDEWLLTCRELGIEQMELHTTDMEEAKEKGISSMIELLEDKICKYVKAISKLKQEEA